MDNLAPLPSKVAHIHQKDIGRMRESSIYGVTSILYFKNATVWKKMSQGAV